MKRSSTASHSESAKRPKNVADPTPAPISTVAHAHSPSHYFIPVTFLVEDTLFRLPRLHFERESALFRDMFTLPVASEAIPDGSSDDQPLHLYGVLKEDFEQLARFMFPERPWMERHFREDFSVFQWISVLKLSTMWEMDTISAVALRQIPSCANREDWTAILDLCEHQHIPRARSLAIKHLTHALYGVKKVLMGRKHRVKSWVVDGLHELVKRESSFSDQEEDELGLKTATKLYRVRELFHRSFSTDSSIGAIRREFEGELKDIPDEDGEPTVVVGRKSPSFRMGSDSDDY